MGSYLCLTTAARYYFFMSLYDRRDFSGTLDALCTHLFGSIKGDMRCLLPTKDAFRMHLFSEPCISWLSQPTYSAATDFGRPNDQWQAGCNNDVEESQTR